MHKDCGERVDCKCFVITVPEMIRWTNSIFAYAIMWFILCKIWNLWALLTKGLRAYAQITSALLTEGCHASAHKTNSPSIKGLRASSDSPCLGPQDKLKGKICFGPWPLGTWFKILVLGDEFAAFGRNILTFVMRYLKWYVYFTANKVLATPLVFVCVY